MELTTLQTLFSGISGLGFLVGILILYKMGILKYLLNGKNGVEDGASRIGAEILQKLLDSQNELKLHYNEETTYELKQMNTNMLRMLTKLEEFEKYGIPCRNKDKI